MAPTHRTPQQRDHRFARIRRLAQSVFLGSGVLSALLITLFANAAHHATSTTTTTTSPTPTTTTTTPSSGVTSTTYAPPTSTTTTTVCTSTPSGHVTCY